MVDVDLNPVYAKTFRWYYDPNRTSFELQLNLEQALWLAGTVLADGQRTLSRRSADA